jgi:asparagine synthase (glutamine-hydrolysing)
MGVSAADGVAAVGATPGRGADFAAFPEPDLLVAVEGRLDEVERIRSDLGLDGRASSARTLAAGYLEWGDDLVAHLRGDFAFVIWDGRRRRVLAARDPFGVRPLHWVTFEGKLCVASDIEQLLAAGVTSSEPDDQRVLEFLLRDSRSLSRSFFRDVSRVPPGHILIATETETRTCDYRRPPSTALAFASVEACHTAFRETFFTAIRRRLSPDGPVVVQVSGGLDSTSIFCAADKLLAGQSHRSVPVVGAFAAFPGLGCDETEYLNAVEAHVNLPIARWDGTLVNGIEFSAPLVAAPGSRIPWSSGTEGYVDIARAYGAESVLDGTGGDQVGIPLGTESDEPALADWRMALRYLQGKPAARGLRVLRWAVGATLPSRVRRLYRRAYRRLRPSEPPDWLASAVSLRAEALESNDQVFLSVEQRMRWRTLIGASLASSIDGKQRHASLSGLEMSFPFLDWDLTQFILALPANLWPGGRWRARLHREALRQDLPAAIYLRRSKAEFTPAVINRVRRNIESVSDLIDGKSWLSGRFVDQGGARRLLAHVRRVPNPDFIAVYHLWAIASVEAWLRRILGYRTA